MPPATDRGLSSTDSHPPTSRTLPACFAATSPDGEAFLAGFARAKRGPLVKGGWPRQRSGGFRRAVPDCPSYPQTAGNPSASLALGTSLVKGRLSSRAPPAQKAPLLGELAELARPEGSRRAFRRRPSPGSTRQLGRGGLPPSLAPLVRTHSRQSVGGGVLDAPPTSRQLPSPPLQHPQIKEAPT